MNIRVTTILLATLLIAACGGPKSGRGFTLPDGNAGTGQIAFAELGCRTCHSVSGVDELRPDGADVLMTVPLGGEVSRIATYGELVTSIINPSHRISNTHLGDIVNPDGTSRMVVLNDKMTVTQLIDLVAFLQSKYELRTPEPTTYPPYTY